VHTTPSLPRILIQLHYHITYLSNFLSFPLLFFLLLRLPPSSTLFPYTTLFRSMFCSTSEAISGGIFSFSMWKLILLFAAVAVVRSEEHTSELQSRFDLVCRLLLEKKKNNKKMKQLDVYITDM